MECMMMSFSGSAIFVSKVSEKMIFLASDTQNDASDALDHWSAALTLAVASVLAVQANVASCCESIAISPSRAAEQSTHVGGCQFPLPLSFSTSNTALESAERA